MLDIGLVRTTQFIDIHFMSNLLIFLLSLEIRIFRKIFYFLAHPWTNFYKSKDYNRHPDMPKKPLSMYMLYYSEKREEILADQPKLSMPEVAKICSEQYQKLSDKKKARYA